MKVSGFTFVRNANKLFYPAKESILSILPIVDEFVVALADSEDDTEDVIKSINSDKIKIVYVDWQPNKYPNGSLYARLTDIAKENCTGDWLFYLQCDEVVHEKYLDGIYKAMKKYVDNKKIEGFVFRYKHFWGDNKHYLLSRAWYQKEVRIVRNIKNIHSWRDAQSFRYYLNNSEEIDYFNRKETRKLNCILLPYYVFHYGWVRPPEVIKNKMKIAAKAYRGEEKAEKEYEKNYKYFDFGPMQRLATYNDSDPKVLQDWVKKIDWKEQLQFSGRPSKLRHLYKHEKLKNRVLSFIEFKIFRGKISFGGFNNFKVIGVEKGNICK